MLICPNKSSKQWKELSDKIGSRQAMLAFIRNGNEIPESEAKARELITNRGILESLRNMPKLSEDNIFGTLKANDFITDNQVKREGKTWYQLADIENIGKRLGEYTEQYGPILEYDNGYVTVAQESVDAWNKVAEVQSAEKLTSTRLAEEFLDKMGISIQERNDVLQRYGSNGIADIAERMVLIQSGMRDVALPEEALHFFLEMLPQDHPALVEALDKIRDRPIYSQTLNQYKNNPNYRIDGQVNFSKIKKEALAKEIAANIKSKDSQTWVGRIIDGILNFIKSITIQKTATEKLQDLFYSDNIGNLNKNLNSSEIYNQLSDEYKAFYEAQLKEATEEQKQTIQQVLKHTASINFNKEQHILTQHNVAEPDGVRLKSVTQVLGSDFYSDLDHIQAVQTILENYAEHFPEVTNSDKVNKYIDSLSSNLDTDEKEKLINKFKSKEIINYISKELMDPESGIDKEFIEAFTPDLANDILKTAENAKKTLFGTAVHSIVESIILGKDIDFDNIDPIIEYFMDKKTLRELIYGKGLKDTGIKGLLQEIQKDGTVLMTEVEVGNSNLGGVIDIVGVKPDGTVDIYDFKTKFLKEHTRNKENIKEEFEQITREQSIFGVKNDPDTLQDVVDKKRSLNQKFTQQLSLYKNILMEAGIPVDKLNIIGVPYRLNENGKIREIKPFVADPIGYNDKIGKHLFNITDPSLDASKKTAKTVSIEDERTKTLDKLSKEGLKETFTKALVRLEELRRFFNTSKDSRKTYELLTDLETKVNKVDEQRTIVKTILDNFENFNDAATLLNAQKSLLEVIDSSVGIIQTVTKEFDRLKSLQSTDEVSAQQRINELQKVNDFISGYETIFKEMLGAIDSNNLDNPLVKRLVDLLGVTSSIKDQYINSILPDVVNLIKDEFSEEGIENMRRTYTENLIAAKQRGDIKLAEDIQKRIDGLPSKETIAETIKGNRGDVGWFFGKFVATISNPDMILAGVAKRLKRVLDRVRLMNKDLRDNLGKEFDKRTAAYGRNIDPKKTNESLVYKVKEFNSSTGKEDMTVLYFKSEYDEKLYNDYKKLQYNLKQAQEEKDDTKIKAARLAVKNFEQKYFESNFTSEYFKLTGILDKNVTYGGKNTTVREIVADIFDKLNSIQRRSNYTDEDITNGNMNDEDLQERFELQQQYASLKEMKDSFGNPKTGEDLKIAEALKEYEKNSRLIYDYVEMTTLFNRKEQEIKLKYGENSLEHEQWIAKNTKLTTIPEYFTRRQEIFDRIKQINNNDNTSEQLAELYRELSVLSKPYRDIDGNIQAQNMKPEITEKIKNIESEIVRLRQNMDGFIMNGNTAEEKEEMKKLNFLKYNDKPYDRERLNELYTIGKQRLEDKINSDPDYEAKFDEMTSLLEELSNMSKKEITDHYFNELEKQKRLFAEANNVSYEEFMKDKDLYQEFKNSDWFIQNHNITKTVLEEGDEDDDEAKGYSVEEPIWCWKRNMPVEKYITRKPADHFYKRVLKDSYTDENGKEIKLKNTDNKDVQDRYKPKSNEDYKKEYGKDHPYLNKEFTTLRDKYNNNTASEKEKVDYENLLFIHKVQLDAQKDIELSQRLGLAVSFQEKHGLERTIESGGNNILQKGNSIWQGVKRSFTSTEQDIDQEGLASSKTQYSRLATMDNNEYKFVPVRFSTKGDADNASYDVWGATLNYVAAINRKKELQKEFALMNGLEKILGDESNQPKSETNNLIANSIFKKYFPEAADKKINSGSNVRLDVLKSFVNTILFNEESFKGYEVLGANSQKVVNQVMKLISRTTLGIAPFNWTTNLISGHVQNVIEAVGGNNISLKKVMEARKIIYTGSSKYGNPIKDMISDYTKSKVGNLSYWGQLMEVFDPIQGEFEDEYGHKTQMNTIKNILNLGVYGGRIWGEWEIQMGTFIAYMSNNKVYDGKVMDRETFITKKVGDITGLSLKEISSKKLDAIKEFDSLEISLLDMFEKDKTGKLVVKNEYKDVFQLGSKEFSEIVAKLHSMQKRLNGSYNKFDRTYIEKTSIGRMTMFFRKHIIPLGVNRWGMRRENFESMTAEEGFYLTFCRSIGKDLIKFRLNNVVNWQNYSDAEKRAIKRTLTDVGIVLSCLAAYTLIGGYNDNDKDKMKKLRRSSWANQALVAELMKIKSETEQFIPLPDMGLNEIKRLYSNPSLILSETTQMLYMSKLLLEQGVNTIPGVHYFDNNLYYQKEVDQGGLGDEGDSKLLHELVRSFIGYSGKTFHPSDMVKSLEYGQRIK